jgi:pyruvate formate lyase activating enzyme
MEAITRRKFLGLCGLCVASLSLGVEGLCQETEVKPFKADAPEKAWKWSKEAYHYNQKGKIAFCNTCPHLCQLAPRDRGVCRSKVNINGRLISLSYGNPSAVHVDPMEKKPLFHFFPGSQIFSVGIAGCNFRCLNCQNWQISQKKPEELDFVELFPEKLVEKASQMNIHFIAFTYSEPISFYEYVYDSSVLAKKNNIRTALISNGFINPTPLKLLTKYIDAANINLKSFSDEIYRNLNGGRLDPVLETLEILSKEGVWLEITTLMVPTYVDDMEMIKRMCGWILNKLGPNHPLHFLRFFPQYKLKRLPPTPIEVLEKARETALYEGIRYVYIGNVPGHSGTNTYCHNCKSLLIERNGYNIKIHGLKEGRCKSCNTSIPGRWQA